MGETGKVDRAFNGHWGRLDAVITKTESKCSFDELFLGSPFHCNAESNQGRPPKRFFVHKRPGK